MDAQQQTSEQHFEESVTPAESCSCLSRIFPLIKSVCGQNDQMPCLDTFRLSRGFNAHSAIYRALYY